MRECKNSEYQYTIIHNKTYVKEYSKNLFKFNLECYLECPKNSHRSEYENLCECKYKFYINKENITTCLDKDQNCKTINYQFLIKDKNQCINNCPLDYSFQFNSYCYNKCPKNSHSKNNNKTCTCLYKYYKKNNEIICLNENEDCNEEFSFYNKNTKECFEICPNDTYIFNKECLLNCTNNKIIYENKCICEYKFYKNNSLFYCLNKNEECPKDFPYLLKNKECINKCPENYLIFNNNCVIECPDNYYIFNKNKTCIKTCPNNYYKTKKKECEISDCIERDIDENILLIHENEYEEFIGNNSCDINKKNYNNFKVQIYNSNYINKEQDNNTSILDISECENLLKEKYNISKNENLTLFKIDYYYDNSSSPIIDYKLYFKDKLLNISYCDDISIKIMIKINLDDYNLDLNKINDALNSNYDAFDSNSEFFNDVCSKFSNSNGTDVPINDRKKDYYANISFCQEGCKYDGFDKIKNIVKCLCNNKIKNEKSNKFNENINNLFSNSNLKVLKCFNLLKNLKNILNNYGSYVFLFCEINEIFLLVFMIKKGNILIMKILNININNHFIKFSPIKRKNYLDYSTSFSMSSSKEKIFKQKNNNKLKSNIDNVVIYKNVGIFEEKIKNDSKNKIIVNKEQKHYTKKNYTNEEINQLDYNESIILDKRNFIEIYYSFLQYSQLIIFTFITKTDFNLRTIKIILFIFSFVLYLTFNTLFFTDDSISHIYNEGGKFDFLYNLPKTIFSGVCCGVINFLLKFLSLSQNDIKKINNIKNKNEKHIKLSKIIKCWKFKLIIFYILIFIFMILFHIYVGTFCEIYVNTQKHLIKSTFISYILSMVYPFGICFGCAIFRKLSLYYKNKILFFCSKILQLF